MKNRTRTPLTDVPATVEAQPAGLKYDSLSVDDRKQILTERLQRLEAEHYSHTVSLKVAKDIGDPVADGLVANTKTALVAIENAHRVIQAELAELG